MRKSVVDDTRACILNHGCYRWLIFSLMIDIS